MAEDNTQRWTLWVCPDCGWNLGQGAQDGRCPDCGSAKRALSVRVVREDALTEAEAEIGRLRRATSLPEAVVLERQRDEWIGKCADAAQAKDEALSERDEARAEIERLEADLAGMRQSMANASDTIGQYQQLTNTDYPGTLRRHIDLGRVVVHALAGPEEGAAAKALRERDEAREQLAQAQADRDDAIDTHREDIAVIFRRAHAGRDALRERTRVAEEQRDKAIEALQQIGHELATVRDGDHEKLQNVAAIVFPAIGDSGASAPSDGPRQTSPTRTGISGVDLERLLHALPAHVDRDRARELFTGGDR